MTDHQEMTQINDFMEWVHERNPGETEFHQAVKEVATFVIPYIEENPIYKKERIFERMTEPDRIISFRVCWEDDNGRVCINRGYRVQFNNAIGPYKGGIRFHPTVNQSVLKFLGFEQTFKNSLTTLPLGGGKGGSDFDPKGRSEREIMRFCQSFMTELYRHIGHYRDVPAGDIGVGAQEVSYLFGQNRRLSGTFTGSMTGKGISFGGSQIRMEATGYGCVFFVEAALGHINDSIEGKTVIISGSGNVAQYAAEKAIVLGAKVVAMSDSSGTLHQPDGINEEMLEFIKEVKNVRRGRIKEVAERFHCHYLEGQRPWHIACDVALPCATQNELDEKDALCLISNGCQLVAEGANMPTTAGATHLLIDNKVIFLPGKAANAGGVAVSGLEMVQNSMRMSWEREDLEQRLHGIMNRIHSACVTHGQDGAHINYIKGANIAGFIKVAEAMLACGIL